jgi:hypothetical protein
MECLGARGGIPTGVSWSAGRPCPQRRRTATTWKAPGGARQVRPRARERGGEAGPRGWMGRKGGGLAQQRLAPFLFFLNFFSALIFQTPFDKFKTFFSLGPRNKSGHK